MEAISLYLVFLYQEDAKFDPDRHWDFGKVLIQEKRQSTYFFSRQTAFIL